MVYRGMLLISMLLTPIASQAQIYKCINNGNTVFSDQPCGDSQKTVTLDEISIMEGMSEEKIQQAGKKTKEVLLQDQISRTQEKIKALRKKMKKEIAYLRHKKLYSRNNLAGATWEESISTEMEAVTSKYKIQIDLHQEEIKQFRDEIKELKSKDAD